MLSNYTLLTILCLMTLAVLCVLVWENSLILQSDKKSLYITYGVIAVSEFAEWVGVQLSGNTDFPTWVLMVVKCVDYTLTPIAGGAIVGQMKPNNIWYKILKYVLAGNAVFQVLSCFFGWTAVIKPDHTYVHGLCASICIGHWTDDHRISDLR